MNQKNKTYHYLLAGRENKVRAPNTSWGDYVDDLIPEGQQNTLVNKYLEQNKVLVFQEKQIIQVLRKTKMVISNMSLKSFKE